MASSSTSSVPRSFKYDVFLSFSGEDTRKNFVDHLHHALERENHIDTYKDDKNMKKGERISTELIKTIEASRFHIIIFSKSYASSSWCLNELVKIMECQKTTEQKAYPVFYDVEPTEVRKQSGAVGKAFAQRRMDEDAGKWRKALKEAADLAGFPLKTTANGHEAQFIETIVEVISKELNSITTSVEEPLVGMETRRDDIVSCLEMAFDDIRMIGIAGIGGGGKTTLARAVFDQISSQFEGKSFVENVREISKSSLFGLKSLQEKILSNVLGKMITINDVHEGKQMMKRKIHGRKVLVVLDDVDHIDQLVALAGEPNWFGPGSRIIITTRDKEVLTTHEVNSIHDVNLLSNEEAIHLFNKFAFKKGEIPNSRFKELSQQVVHHAGGLPLTIKVLGRDLKGKDEVEYWKDYLKRLKAIPPEETLKQLELSYVSLKDDYKTIFLDVACVWIGVEKDQAIRALESCNLHPIVGLGVLERKSLVTVSEEGTLEMHDSIRDMGRDIVRREHRDEPHKHSRLWIVEEIENILLNDLGTDATRCISWTMEFNQTITMKGLRQMKNLRFLHLLSPYLDDLINDGDIDSSDASCEVDEVCQYFPDALQYLFWWAYPFRCLPNTFRAKNLVGLEMPFYLGGQLWESGEREVLKKLKYLVLDCSKLRTLDLGVTPNLETLSLDVCSSLKELHIPHKHPKLKSLHLTCSQYLKSFDLRQTPNLEILSLEECDDLEELHMPDEFPPLKSLDLIRCSNLKIIDLRRTLNLETLYLQVCDDLVKLHMPDGLPKLESLFLEYSKLRTLDLGRTLNPEPSSLEGCDDLVALRMPRGCPNLQYLHLICSNLNSLNLGMTPQLKSLILYPSKLKTIDLNQTVNLETLSLTGCHDLLHISIGCPKLKSLELECSKMETLDLRQTTSLEMLSLFGCHDLLHISIGCPKLKSLKLECSKMETLDLRQTTSLEMLSLYGCHDLLHISIGCPKLKSLELFHSKLETLDLRQTTSLEMLSLYGCHDLLHISIGCPKLKSLELFHSKLETLDLRQTVNLYKLHLFECCALVELSMPVQCLKLKTLELSCSKLRTLDLEGTLNLETLTLKECDDLVEILMPAACPKLESLVLSDSKMRTLDLRVTTNLERLKLRNCDDLVELSLPFKCPKLKTLDLSCSKLRSLNLGPSPNLEELILRKCDDLVKLCMPVACPKLKTLILTHSKLRILNLRQTPYLESLELIACSDMVKLRMSRCLKLRRLKLSSLSNLRTFDLWLTPNLKELTLVDCCNSVKLHAPSGCLEKMNVSVSPSCSEPVDVCPLHPNNNFPKFRCKCYYPSSVGKPEKLISVGLCACTNLKKISRSICGLQCLRKLTLDHSVPEVPKDLGRLENLEELSLILCREILHLPDSICDLQRLRKLTLKGSIREVPKDLGRLKNLEELSLILCGEIMHLPDSICDLQRFRTLTIKGSIREVPKDLGRLENLEELSFVDTEIIHLPDSICMLKHLKSLKLERCLLLEKLPEDLGRLQCLEELFLSYCERLRDIPKSIGDMKCLQYLHLSYCMKVKKFPEGLGHLVRLKRLWIEGTRISHLPHAILLLKGVRIFGSHQLLLSSGFTCVTKFREDIFECRTEEGEYTTSGDSQG